MSQKPIFCAVMPERFEASPGAGPPRHEGWSLALQARRGDHASITPAPGSRVNIALPPAPLRHVPLGALDVEVEERAGGVLYIRSQHPLPAYPDRLTDRLDHYARETPERVFIAERDPSGGW